MPVWVRFPVLPAKYYTERWLRQARNHIGHTVKVDITTLLASRGMFARVCVEVDLDKPLMGGGGTGCDVNTTGCTMSDCMSCALGECAMGIYKDATCSEKSKGKGSSGSEHVTGGVGASDGAGRKSVAEEQSGYGEWTTVQRSHHWQGNNRKGNMVNS